MAAEEAYFFEVRAAAPSSALRCRIVSPHWAVKLSPGPAQLAASLLQADGDASFEEELARNPYAIKVWLQYIASKKAARPRVRRRVSQVVLVVGRWS